MSLPTGLKKLLQYRLISTMAPGLVASMFFFCFLTACGASAIATAKQHLLAGQTESARQVLEVAIAEDPEDGKVGLMLALIDMSEDDCESARRRLEHVSGISDTFRETVEEYYIPLVEAYESILWAELRPEPDMNAELLYRFQGPITIDRALQTRGDQVQVTIRSWIPNDDRVDRFKDSPVIKVLFDTPEMVYADITAWTDQGLVVARQSFTPLPGTHVSLVYLDYCPTEDGKVLVYGTVINDGSQVASELKALVRAIYMDLNSEMMISIPSSGFTNPILSALDMTMMPRMDEGFALVPIRPQELQPGQKGIIVLTVEVPDPNVFLLLDADFQYRKQP